jgi:hypothetical protein
MYIYRKGWFVISKNKISRLKKLHIIDLVENYLSHFY